MNIADSHTAFLDTLSWRSENHPDQAAFIFLGDGENESRRLTFGELDQEARAIALGLQEHNAPGERAMLLYPPGLEFICAFLGCLYAGVIAVPAFPPRRSRPNPHLEAMAKDAQAHFALSTSQQIENLGARLSKSPRLNELAWIASDALAISLETDNAEGLEPRQKDLNDLAYLQYTSGSTSAPKGVMVSHGNLVANLASLLEGVQYTAESIGVSWLPHFHDMGLVGCILPSLYVGRPSIMMPPMAFLQKPANWLKAISTYGGTHSGCPNFGYELCIQKVDPDQIEGLDLSTWRWASSGAETIRQGTMERFQDKFGPYGFRSTAITHIYGLAEATLFVSSGDIDTEPVYSQGIAGCGWGRKDTEFVIVDPQSEKACDDGMTGEIWVRGGSVALGYWGREQETMDTFQAHIADTGEGPFLRTGDLGLFHDDELFITGRLKDLIIIRGQNYYPEDIELTVGEATLNISNTIGCFVSYFPYVLACKPDQQVASACNQVQESMRAIPHGGRIFDVLKYFISDEKIREEFSVFPKPEFSFSYRQRLHGRTRERGSFTLLKSLVYNHLPQVGQKIITRVYCDAFLTRKVLEWEIYAAFTDQSREEIVGINAEIRK